ncbi:MAG: DeoR/GlpR family DNA-binding transcription regulator [Planctomycetaceae bacterium]|nr:DeoR/GlpR family DNA-binding transcription regulator [Planctomycetaceae bacterium]
MGLLAEQRNQHIMESIRTRGRILVTQLAQELKVTEVTIRRDLAKLEKHGLLKKTYGGAVLGAAEMNASVRYRQTRNLAAKRIIGKLAADLIHDGDCIYLEAGSTCYEIIPHLAHKNNLTIIVNSLYLMSRLHEQVQHRIVLTGGLYRPERMDMIGPAAENAISQLAGFTAFTGADDITLETGISGADVATVSFTKIVLRKAARIIFVGDSSKFDNPALYKIADIDQLDAIVTNTMPGNEWAIACKELEIPLICPDERELKAMV